MKKLLNILFIIISLSVWGQTDVYWNSLLPNGMELSMPTADSLYRIVHSSVLENLSGVVATAYKGDTLFATDGQTLYVIYNDALVDQYNLNQHNAGQEQAYIVTLFINQQRQTKIITNVDDTLKVFTWPDITHPQIVATGIEPVIDVGSRLHEIINTNDTVYNELNIAYLKGQQLYVYHSQKLYGSDTTYNFSGISYTSPVRLLKYYDRAVAIVYGDSINLYIFNDQASIYDQGSYKWNVSDVVIDNQSFIVSTDTNIYFTDNGCSVENWIKLPSSFQVKQLMPTPYGQLILMPEQPGQVYALYNMRYIYHPELVVIDTLNQIYSYPINSVTGYNTFFYYELPQSMASCMRTAFELIENTDYAPVLEADTIDLPRANVMVKVQDTIGLYQAYGRDIKKRLQDTMPVITTYISASDAHIDFWRVDDTTFQLNAQGQEYSISEPVQWYYNDSLIDTEPSITVNQEGTYTLRISDSKCTKDTSVDIFFKHRTDLFWNSYLPNQMELSAPTADSIYRLLPNSALEALSGIVATAYKGDTLFATDGQTLYVIYNNSLISEYHLNQHPAGREQAYILTMFYKEQEQTKIITDIDDTLKIFTWPDISHPHILATGIEPVIDVGSQVHFDMDDIGNYSYNDMSVAYLKDGNFYLCNQPDLIKGCTTQVHNNLTYDSSVQIIKYRNYQLAIKDDTSVRLIRFQGDLQTIEYEQSNDWPATDIAIAKNSFIISTDTSIITTNIRYKRFIDLPSSYKVKQLLFTDYGQLIAYPQSSGDLYALFNSNLYYMGYSYLRKIGSISEVYEPYINQVNYPLFYINPEYDRASACQRANILVQINPYNDVKSFYYDFPEADSVTKIQSTIDFNDVNSVRVIDHIQDTLGIVSTYLWGEKPYISYWPEGDTAYSLQARLNGDIFFGNLKWVYKDSVISQNNNTVTINQEGTYTLRVQDSKCTFDTSTYILFGYKADLFWNSFLPNGMELAVPSSQSLYKQVDNATLDALSGIVATAYKGDTLFATDGQTLYVIYNNSLIGQYHLNQHTAGFEQAYIVTLFYKTQKQTKIITDIDDSLKIFTWPDIAHPQLVATGIEPVVDVSSHLTSGTGDIGDFLYNNLIITYLKNNNAYVYRIEDLLSSDSVVVYNGLNYVSPVSLVRYSDNKLALTDKVNSKFFNVFESYVENHFSISLEPSDIYVNNNYFVLSTDSTIIFMNQDSSGYTVDLPSSYKVKQFIPTPYGQLLLYPEDDGDIYAIYNINEEQQSYFTIQKAGNISQIYDLPINIVQGYNPFIELTNEDRPLAGCLRTTIYTRMLPLNNEISWKNVDMPEPGVEQQIIDTISLMKFSSIRVNSHVQDTSAIIFTYYKGAKAYISIDGKYLQAMAGSMLLQDSVKWFFDGQPDILSTQPSIIPTQEGQYKLQVEDSKCTYQTQINFTFHHQADLFWNSFLPNGMELAAPTSDSLYRIVHNQALESLNGIVATSYRGDTLFATDGQTLYVIYNNSLVGQYHLNQHTAGREQAYIMTIFYKEQEQTKIITSVDDTLKIFTWPDIAHPKIVATEIEPVVDVISRLYSGNDAIGDFLYNDMKIGYLKNHKFYLYQKVELDSVATITSYDNVNYSSPVKLIRLFNSSVAYMGYEDFQIALFDKDSLKVYYPGTPDAHTFSVIPNDVEFVKDHLFVSTPSKIYIYYIWDYSKVDSLQIPDVKQIIRTPYGQILFYPEHSGQMYYINNPADSIIHQADYIQQPYAYPMNIVNGYSPVLLPYISTLTGCQDAIFGVKIKTAYEDTRIDKKNIELPMPGTLVTLQDTVNLNFLRGANQDSLSGIVLVNHTQFDKAILFGSFITTPPTNLQIEQTDSTSWNLELYPSEHIEWYRGNQLLDTTSSIQVDKKGFYTLRVKNNLCTYDTTFDVYAQLKNIYELTNMNNYNYKLNDKVELEDEYMYENQGLVADTLRAKFYLDSTTDYYHDLSSKINYTLLYDYKQKSDSSEFITPVGNSGKHLMGFWISPKQSQSNYPMLYSQYPVEIFSLKLKPIMQKRNYVVGDTARFYIAQDTENADLYIDKHYSNNNFVKFHRTNDSTWLADIAIDQSTSRDIIHPDQLRLALMIATNHADKLKLALVSPDGKEEQVFSGFANPDNNQYIIGNPFCLKYNPDMSAETTDEYNQVPEYLGMYPLLFSENGQKLDKTRFPTRSYSDCAMEPENLNVFDYKSNAIMTDFSPFYGSPVAGSWILKVSFPNGPGYYLNIRPFLILSKQDMPHDIFQDTIFHEHLNGNGNFDMINDTALVLTEVSKDTIYFMFDLDYRFESMENNQTDSAFFVLNVLKGRILYDDQTHTFSPNGDGINDSLNIFTKIVNKFPSLKDINPIDVKIYILNNKGVIIKTLDGATSLSWDGTDRHGKQVASGVYWYIAVIRDQKYYGTIFLLR